MAGPGTGQPLIFGCAKCRINFWTPSRKNYGTVDRIELTGRKRNRTRSQRAHRATERTGNVARQYRCLDCGHVGWSFHYDLECKEKREPPKKLPELIRFEARLPVIAFNDKWCHEDCCGFGYDEQADPECVYWDVGLEIDYKAPYAIGMKYMRCKVCKEEEKKRT